MPYKDAESRRLYSILHYQNNKDYYHAKSKRWIEQNHKKWRSYATIYMRERRFQEPEPSRFSNRKYHWSHRQQRVEHSKFYRRKYLDGLRRLLGGVCVKCNFMNFTILEIDHRFGDGHTDRKNFRGNYNMYKYYYEHPAEAIKKLQLLCPNCNKLKQHFKKEFGSRHAGKYPSLCESSPEN